MAIRLTNGTNRTMPYEDIDQYLTTLRQRQEEYEVQSEFTAAAIYKKFKGLVSDYKAGIISKDVFHEHLKKMTGYFRTVKAPYPQALKANDVFEVMEKEGIDWR
jgi:hypothetical protein